MSTFEQSMAEQSPPKPPKRSYRLKKVVVMVGMMGAGKTAVGRALATRLDVPFLDSDQEIEAAANLTIPEIFDRYGEAFFREKETQVMARLLDLERGVLSTGGGTFLSDCNRYLISERGVSFWLKADLEVLWNRIRHKDTRPLLRTPDPRTTLATLFAARDPLYGLADLFAETDGDMSVEDMVDRVIASLLTRPDILEDVK
ncbi:MAG: shikimate kinase [Rhodobacteraceae bacterium]|nr:shikimate kinase [Paracoccaceae bacterium]